MENPGQIRVEINTAASNTAQVSLHSLELALLHHFLGRQVTKAWKRLGLILGTLAQ
jgi:hypothetical protein